MSDSVKPGPHLVLVDKPDSDSDGERKSNVFPLTLRPPGVGVPVVPKIATATQRMVLKAVGCPAVKGPRKAGGRAKRLTPTLKIQGFSENMDTPTHEVIIERMKADRIQPAGEGILGDDDQTKLTLNGTNRLLLGLEQANYFAVAKILFQWRAPRLISGDHIRGIVRLLHDGRNASIISNLQAMATYAPNLTPPRLSHADRTPDDAQADVSDEVGHLFDEE